LGKASPPGFVKLKCKNPKKAAMPFFSIRDLNLSGKRVSIRVDFNVPLQKHNQGEMEITSDKRIQASLPTIRYALEAQSF